MLIVAPWQQPQGLTHAPSEGTSVQACTVHSTDTCVRTRHAVSPKRAPCAEAAGQVEGQGAEGLARKNGIKYV